MCLFCSLKVDERVRANMFKLRQTWNDVFPPKKLYAIDVRVHSIDPAWPITAPPPTANIHVNPQFLRKVSDAIQLIHIHREILLQELVKNAKNFIRESVSFIEG